MSQQGNEVNEGGASASCKMDQATPVSSDNDDDSYVPSYVLKEQNIEDGFIEKLRSLKYTERPDIRDRAALERNFRQKFEALNRVRLTDGEFQRLLEELITPDVFTADRVLRERNDFTRDDGTPLAYTLVNIKDWCKNDFEVIHPHQHRLQPHPIAEPHPVPANGHAITAYSTPRGFSTRCDALRTSIPTTLPSLS